MSKFKKEYKRLIPEMILMASIVFTSATALNLMSIESNYNREVTALEHDKRVLKLDSADPNEINSKIRLIDARIDEIQAQHDNSKSLKDATLSTIAGASAMALSAGAIAIRNNKEQEEIEQTQNTL